VGAHAPTHTIFSVISGSECAFVMQPCAVILLSCRDKIHAMIKLTSFGPVTRIDLARTLAGRGRYWTTAYLVDGLLIDSGCAHSVPELLACLRAEPLTHLVNTHTHEDHIGGNGPLQQMNAGLKILAHPLALPVLTAPRERQPLHPYRRLMWGWPEPSQGEGISDGKVIRTQNFGFQVIYTSGHSQDHICLYEPDCGWLFSGDLYVGGRDRALSAGADIWGVIASLKKIAGLPLSKLFPGSARVRENPRTELQNKIDYLEEMGERVWDLRQGGESANAIARSLFKGPMLIELITLGHFSRRNLVRSYLRKVEPEA
jgi:glyoxylase-like metal-dependent hydrolase (beta-lactamase superfamily II)